MVQEPPLCLTGTWMNPATLPLKPRHRQKLQAGGVECGAKAMFSDNLLDTRPETKVIVPFTPDIHNLLESFGRTTRI